MVVIGNDPEGRKPAKSLSEEETAELIERLGGAEALKKSFADFREVTDRYLQDKKVLVEQHPNKWAIVDKDGLVAALDTRSEAGKYARANGLKSSQFMIVYLEQNPPALILR